MKTMEELATQMGELSREAQGIANAQKEAQATFVDLVRQGAPDRHIEAARLICVSTFERQLDMIKEAGLVMRAMSEKLGGP